MTDPLAMLADHGRLLLAGTTLLLALGVLSVLLNRSPIHRQRIGEWTVLGTLVWLFLATIPLPRVPLEDLWPAVEIGQADVVESNRAMESRREAAALPVWPSDTNALSEFEDLDPTSNPTPKAISVVPPAEAAPVADSLLIELGATAGLSSSASHSLEDSARQASSSTHLPDRSVAEHPRPAIDEALPASAPYGWLDAQAALPFAYVIGAGVCLAWLGFGQWLLGRSLRRGVAPDEAMRRVYESLPVPDGRRRPRLLVSDHFSRPVTCGILRPTIVLPAGCLRTESGTWLRHVLLHELGHHRQRDAWSHLFFNLALPVLYFHPLYWWLRGSVELSRELIADDWAARHSTPTEYADEMIGLVRRGGSSPAPLSVVGIYSSPSQFYRRMSMLIQRERPLSTCCSAWWRAAALLVCASIVVAFAGLAGVPYTIAQESEPPATDAEAVIDETLQESESADATLQELQETDGQSTDEHHQLLEAALKALQAQLARTQVETDSLNTWYESLMETARSAESETVQHRIGLHLDRLNSLHRSQQNLSRVLREVDGQIQMTKAAIKKAEDPQTSEKVVRDEMLRDPRFQNLQMRKTELESNFSTAEAGSDDPNNSARQRFESKLNALDAEEQKLVDELRPMIAEGLQTTTIPQWKTDLAILQEQKKAIEQEFAANKQDIAKLQEQLKGLGIASSELDQLIQEMEHQRSLADEYRQLIARLVAATNSDEKPARLDALDLLNLARYHAADPNALLNSLAQQTDVEYQKQAALQKATALQLANEQLKAQQNAQAAEQAAQLAALLAQLKNAEQASVAQQDSLAAEVAKLREENARLQAKLAEQAKTADGAAVQQQIASGQPIQGDARSNAGLARLGASSSSLDLIGLANNFAEAAAEVELAMIAIRNAERASIEGADAGALDVAKVRYHTARKKVKLMRAIVEALIEGAEQEYASRTEDVDRVKMLHDRNVISATEVRDAEQAAAQAQFNIHILKLILDSD